MSAVCCVRWLSPCSFHGFNSPVNAALHVLHAGRWVRRREQLQRFCESGEANVAVLCPMLTALGIFFTDTDAQARTDTQTHRQTCIHAYRQTHSTQAHQRALFLLGISFC